MLKESQLNHGAMSLRECKRFRDSLSHFSKFDSKNHLVVLHMMHDQLFSLDSTELTLSKKFESPAWRPSFFSAPTACNITQKLLP